MLQGQKLWLGSFLGFLTSTFKRIQWYFLTMSGIRTNQSRHLQDIPLQSFCSFQQHYQRVKPVILYHCGSDIYMCDQYWQAAENEGRLAY